MISMPIDDIPQLKPKTVVPGETSQSEADPIQKNEAEGLSIPKLGEDNKKSLKQRILIKDRLKGRKVKALLIGGMVVFVLFLATLIPSLIVYGKAKAVYASAQDVLAAGEQQNLPAVKSELQETEKALVSLQRSLSFLSLVVTQKT
jgi:cytochrome c-type biogenesis protein CcmH/NrfG